MARFEHANTVLSLTLSHDAGAAIFCDGNLVAAINEERLNRKKNTRVFPVLSILRVLEVANKKPKEVNRVLIGSRITPNLLSLLLPNLRARESENLFSPLLAGVIGEQILFRKTGLIHLEAALIKFYIRKQLSKLGLFAPIEMFDHHLSHSYSAYSAASFDNSLVITLDAMGDGLCGMVSLGDGGNLQIIRKLNGYKSPALIYSRITQFLGFTPGRHEGKLTGLAAFGDPNVCDSLMRNFLSFSGNSFRTYQTANINNHIYKSLRNHKPEDVAAALQNVFEEIIVRYIYQEVKKSGRKNLALAGGAMANVKLNQRIKEIAGLQNIFIFPHMSDGGLSVGAGFAYFKTPPSGIRTIYLGGSFSETDAQVSLTKASFPYKKPDYLEEEISKLLTNGKVVARVCGGMEFGPRALGNRSILYRPDDPSVNEWLNKKLDRTEFMPFAPSTLEHLAESYYKNVKGAEIAARYMTMTFDCTDAGKACHPAGVHVDGTARPQLINATDNPSFYRIVQKFYEKTGMGSILNTSFNIHEEPIVEGPEDAIKAFVQSGVDVLVLGDFLVFRK